MKRWSVPLFVASMFIVTGSLAAQDATEAMTPTNFTVRIENVSGNNTQTYSTIGIDGVPVGATARRPAMPGEAFEFTVKAAPGDYLSFATMYGQSNDSFFGPADDGIALFDDSGAPINGDVSDQVKIWDAGTEVNEPLGTGENQAPRQAAPNTGEAENGTVELQTDPDFPTSPVLTVTLESMDGIWFHVRIENHSDMAKVPTPISPLAYVVHTADQHAPFFTTGEADRGQGLERIAEDGNPEDLAAAVAGSAVMNVGLSPGVFVVYGADHGSPIFTSGEADRGEGLEAQAEDGNPDPLSMGLEGMMLNQIGVFNTAVGADKAGPLMPGGAFEFTFTAMPGDVFTFSEMFGQSNDLFFSPDENGIALFSGSGKPISGTFTGAVQLWDAGTEVNQEPFVGSDQAPRQAAPNTGAAEGGVVTPIYAVNDGFSYPSVFASLKLTITNDSMTPAPNMMSMDDMMGMDSMSSMDNGSMDSMDMTPEATPAM